MARFGEDAYYDEPDEAYGDEDDNQDVGDDYYNYDGAEGVAAVEEDDGAEVVGEVLHDGDEAQVVVEDVGEDYFDEDEDEDHQKQKQQSSQQQQSENQAGGESAGAAPRTYDDSIFEEEAPPPQQQQTQQQQQQSSKMQCPNCGSTEIESHDASGASVCTECGVVVEENAIVSSVEFVEGAGGSSSMVGRFVSATSSKAYGGGGGGGARGHPMGFSRDSRETTLANGRRRIQEVASRLRLGATYVDAAHRLFMIAVEKNFVQGRRTTHVVSACLYIACRQEKSQHMLIDFSDALQVNVYALGSTFLKFRRLLGLKVEIIDPALYVYRFAAHLDLNEKANAVALTALRLVGRMKRDWIVTGRRPAGICAAALLIAARAHGFQKHHSDVTRILRICGWTVTSRVREFEATPSAQQLTLDQFHTVDLEHEADPPVFRRNKIREARAQAILDGNVQLLESGALDDPDQGKRASKWRNSAALETSKLTTRAQARSAKFEELYESLQQELYHGGAKSGNGDTGEGEEKEENEENGDDNNNNESSTSANAVGGGSSNQNDKDGNHQDVTTATTTTAAGIADSSAAAAAAVAAAADAAMDPSSVAAAGPGDDEEDDSEDGSRRSRRGLKRKRKRQDKEVHFNETALVAKPGKNNDHGDDDEEEEEDGKPAAKPSAQQHQQLQVAASQQDGKGVPAAFSSTTKDPTTQESLPVPTGPWKNAYPKTQMGRNIILPNHATAEERQVSVVPVEGQLSLAEWKENLPDSIEKEIEGLFRSEEEVKQKEAIFVKINKDYLEQQKRKEQERKEQEARARDLEQQDAAQAVGHARYSSRRGRGRGRAGGTTEEALLAAVSNRKISRKINYDALSNLFDDDGGFSVASDRGNAGGGGGGGGNTGEEDMGAMI